MPADPAASNEGIVQRLVRAAEIDTRMLGMLGALLIIWVGFDVDQRHPAPRQRRPFRRLIPDAAQLVDSPGPDLDDRGDDHRHGAGHRTAPDRPVGRLDAQRRRRGDRRAAGVRPRSDAGRRPSRRSGSSPWSLPLALGAAIGAFNGFLIAYGQIPSFIVTLGGLIAFSGAAFLIASGVTVAPMDKTFKLIGGNGPLASIGPLWSWALAAVACIVHRASPSSLARRRRIRFNFTPKPVWAEILHRYCRLRGGAGHDGGRQFLPLAAARRGALCGRKQHPDPAGDRKPGRPRHLHGRPTRW